MGIRTLAIGSAATAALAVILLGFAGVFTDAPRASEDDEHDEVLLTGAQQGTQRLAGSRLRLYQAQLADVFAAGGEIQFDQVTADDLFLAGGSIRLREVAAEDLTVAGGEILLQAQLRDDLLAAGGRIRLDPQTVINGDAVIAGGDLEIAGRIDGNVTAAGGRIVLAAVIGGDVDVSGAEVVVDPRARIAGQLVYRGDESAQISTQAVIGGGVRHEATRMPRVSRWTIAGFGMGVLLVVLFGMILMASVSLAAIPHTIDAAVRGFHARPWASWMIGFALLVAIPVAANIALLTVVGIPLGLLLYALYATGLALAAVTAARELGRILTRSERATPAVPVTMSQLGRSALGMLALLVLAIIPLLGWLALLAVIPAAVGALATECWRRARAATAAFEPA